MTGQLWRGSWFRAQERLYPVEHIFTRKPLRRSLAPGERRLASFILPPFQRPSVWTAEQKVKLIESFLDQLPIPFYVANMDTRMPYTYDCWLLDGQQRITAVVEFVEGRFPVRGRYFNEASESDRAWFLWRPFGYLETELRNEALLKEIHDRLAHGGTPHEAPQ